MRIKYLISFVTCFVFLLALMYLAFAPVINTLDECKDRGWDGSEYNTGVREIKLFQESENIIIKCNKEPKETDAMLGILDALRGKDE